MKKYFTTFLLFLLLYVTSFAQEGMWLLNQLDQLDLKNKGLKIEVSDIYNNQKPSLSSAVVQLGGGTASFVSPEGLIVTNHHVAYTALQRASDVKSDFLTNGFLASKHEEEIKAPGYVAQMLTEMKDVTSEIVDAGKAAGDAVSRDKLINAKISQMTEAIRNSRDDINATVAQMYNGKQYILFVYQLFKDIRIVYSPPLSIGKFGGEIDNWMWPRHTGDFSFLRVYVAPDGTGKEFDKTNVPYKPKVWLKVAKDNIKDGDFTFVVGFPGFTTRYRSSNSVEWNYKYNYPFTIKNYKEIIQLLDDVTKNDHAGELKVASLKTGLANTLKNYEGKVSGMKKTNFLQKKLNFEKIFMTWINFDPQRKEKYGDLISREKAEYNVIAKTRERDNVFGILQGLAGTQLSVAEQIVFIVSQMEKPAGERQPGFTERAVDQSIDNIQYTYANAYDPADKAMLVRALKMANDLPQDQRIKPLEYIFADKSKTIEQFVDDAAKATKLNDIEYAKSLFKKTSKELEALNDPFIKMALCMQPLSDEITDVNNTFGSNVTAIRKQYLDALYEWKGSGLYPDANSTIRFTSGRIKGYSPADAVWYYPFTTLKGVIEKNTGEEPFDVPAGLTDLYNKKDYGIWMDPVLKDVPVAFTHQVDITGGNSGSPVMNAKGELIGVVFDGNYEAMISDWQYDLDLQRCISVDIRYVLFVTEKYGKAGFILDEMGVDR
jgi:hypothetical protein